MNPTTNDRAASDALFALANEARLIAAALELLAALRGLEKAIRMGTLTTNQVCFDYPDARDVEGVSHRESVEAMMASLKSARAAIARAEGGTR